MIYLLLFWTFFQIGLFTFGGGYAMIPMIEEMIVTRGWLSMDDLSAFIAIAESTPGPFAINIATFVGSHQAGVLGAMSATLGVVLPSFLVILLIAAIFKNFNKQPQVQAALSGIRPVIVALIFFVGLTLFLNKSGINTGLFQWRYLLILGILLLLKWRYRRIHPIIFLVVAGSLGILSHLI